MIIMMTPCFKCFDAIEEPNKNNTTTNQNYINKRWFSLLAIAFRFVEFVNALEYHTSM